MGPFLMPMSIFIESVEVGVPQVMGPLLASCWLICAMELMGSNLEFIPIPGLEVGVDGLRGTLSGPMLLPGPPPDIWLPLGEMPPLGPAGPGKRVPPGLGTGYRWPSGPGVRGPCPGGPPGLGARKRWPPSPPGAPGVSGVPGPLPILCGFGPPPPEALLGISPVCGLGTGKFMLALSPCTLLGV